MIIPPYLQAGDTLAIIATARKISLPELEPACQWLREQGYQLKLGQSIGAEDRQFAGSDELRRADLQEQLNDPEVKAILCARGGYGSVRLVDGLVWDRFMQQPKWICGYSDITVLHAELQKRHTASIHSTMPLNFESSSASLRSWESLDRALKGKHLVYDLSKLHFERGTEMEAEVIGGNLSVIYSLMGSNSLPDFRGKILFLEDLDEYLYHVDRMMMCLKRAGVLSQLAGLLVGGLTKMNDNAIGFGRTAEQILLEAVAPYDYPIAFGFPAGHQPLNQSIRLGMPLRITSQ
ncbi:MAG: LD-carboxypeptidase [Bacteroidia bacterium]